MERENKWEWKREKKPRARQTSRARQKPRALREAEKELGITGRLITPENYLTDFVDGY